jgi:hypothetical protein
VTKLGRITILRYEMSSYKLVENIAKELHNSYSDT